MILKPLLQDRGRLFRKVASALPVERTLVYTECRLESVARVRLWWYMCTIGTVGGKCRRWGVIRVLRMSSFVCVYWGGRLPFCEVAGSTLIL